MAPALRGPFSPLCTPFARSVALRSVFPWRGARRQDFLDATYEVIPTAEPVYIQTGRSRQRALSRKPLYAAP